MTVNIDGLNINYIEKGEGPAVLMLHGWGSSVAAYKGIMNVLSPTHRCIALDFPGCGDSDIMPSAWTLDDYTDLVAKFIAALGLDNPVLMGHSHGGRVALKMAADHTVEPQKMVLLDAAGLIPEKSIKQKVRQNNFKAIKKVFSIFGSSGQKVIEKARKHYGSADYNSAPPVLRETLVKLVNTDIRDELYKIDASTLLIWGENDTATPLADAKIIEKSIKDCGLCVIPNTGHWSFVENPVLAHAIIKNFLG